MTAPAGESVTAETRYDSAWSTTAAHHTAPDEAAPPIPAPAQTARSGATLRLLHDGLGQAGETMPADLEAVEAHLSTAASYTPTSPADRAEVAFDLAADTYRTDLRAGVPATITGLGTSTTYYLILVARDRAGNRSTPSAPVAV